MMDKEFAKNTFSAGSALILTVVLTTLLAIVGVMFVMTARVDKIATSAISENRELDFAIETVVAKISQELASDVPGVAGQEYYDYPNHRLDPGPDSSLGTKDDSLFDPGINGIYDKGLVDDVAITGIFDDLWLASLEPEIVNVAADMGLPPDMKIGFRHISDLYGRLAYLFQDSFDYPNNRVDYGDLDGDRIGFRNLRATIIDDPMAPIVNEGDKADADGDGVADSRWIRLPNMSSSKGKPIYAAIRIIGNGAMLNVNTAYKFDPCDPNTIDGSSQLQINLMALAGRPGYTDAEAAQLREERANYPGSGIDPNNLDEYEKNVVWRYYRPNGAYTPFDIADELELRNRFLLNHSSIDTRLEKWGGEFRNKWTSSTPFDDDSEWFRSAYYGAPFDPNYAYRHIATIYNIDRIIRPRPGLNGDRKMININEETDDANDLYNALVNSIDPGIAGLIRRQIEQRFAQLTVNIIDFADGDDDNNRPGFLDPNSVTTFVDPCGVIYSGFEAQPFITEVGMLIHPQPETGLNYFAVELYNPFDKIIDLNDFVLELVNSNDPCDIRFITFNDPCDIINPNSHFVIANNPSAFTIYNLTNPDNRTNIKLDPRLVLLSGWRIADKSKPPADSRGRPDKSKPPIYTGWENSYNLFLKRRVYVRDLGYIGIYVDRHIIYPGWAPAAIEQYFRRDVRDWHVVYQIWEEGFGSPYGNLGGWNPEGLTGHNFSFFLPNPLNPGQKFVTVGDIPRILTIGHGIEPNSTIGEQLWRTPINLEGRIRLDLQNPYHRNVFQYLTVFDPTSDNIDNDGDGFGVGTIDSDELKIPGRININTAPWFVIAQLPWVSNELAQAIVAYRDKLNLSPSGPDYSNGRGFGINPITPPIVREDPGFESIGELNFVIAGNIPYSIQQYRLDNMELIGFPDLTPIDGYPNDFEERDIIFSRISNLVTVRSDVFTAYILVRIGTDGPQQRVIAILDRSDVYSGNGRVRIVALHPVPDPR